MSDNNEVIANGVANNNGSPVKPNAAEANGAKSFLEETTKTEANAAKFEATKTPLDEESRDSTVQSASVDDEEELSGDDAHDEEEEQDDEAEEADEQEESLQEAENGKTNGESKGHKRSAGAAVDGDEEEETSQKKKRVEPEDSTADSEAVASAE